MDTLARLAVPTVEASLDEVWTRFVSSPAQAEHMALWRELAAGNDAARQRLAFAVLVQLAADPPAAGAGGRGGRGGGGGRGRGGLNPAVVERARTDARTVIDAAWDSPNAASLVWSVGRTGGTRYQDRVSAAASSSSAAVRDAATYAIARLNALAVAPKAATPAAGPAVASIAYEEMVGRLASATGDPALGRKLFAQQACSACHTTAAGEPERGPHLGGIFTRYSKAEVIESILRPAAKVAQGFATYSFTTADKRQLSGFVIRDGQSDIVIRDLTGTETTLRKNEIVNRSVSEGSTMPPGLVDTLTLQELASLLAFLESTVAK